MNFLESLKSAIQSIKGNKMIAESNLDVRTITMGISLLDCADPDVLEREDRRV